MPHMYLRTSHGAGPSSGPQLTHNNPRDLMVQAVDTRALGSVPGMVMITGDGNGRVRIFQWK